MKSKRIVFQHGRSFLLKEELGRGACGQTVLLHDEAIDELFVCKKYAPLDEAWREQLFAAFLREIKLMHAVHHINLVRVFNYIVYPERLSGYIFMEYVKGLDIDAHIAVHPEDINQLFLQVIEGFAHLESRQILHRDIRTSNILVSEGGVIKIIDFGFGKQTVVSADFDKSISLNWWCALPPEFSAGTYNYATEVYFVGKLFEVLIEKHELAHFQYAALVRRMVVPALDKRIESFAAVRQELLGQPRSIEFSDDDINCYRQFAQVLVERLSKVGSNSTCFGIDDIQLKLEDAFKTMMLEHSAPDSDVVIACIIKGRYRYYTNKNFPVQYVRDFLDLLRRCSKEQRNIVEANLRARIVALPKIAATPTGFDDMDDDIPF